MGIPVVFEGAEPAIQAHIDARRLDHVLVKGVNAHTSGFDFSKEVAVTQQHPPRLSERLPQAVQNVDIEQVLWPS